MGAKTGYADAILRVLGLAPGARAAHYLWCEPDPGVRLLLEAYRDADLARAAAAIIRSWADEEPRALWERLRAEGPPVLPATGPEVARWQVLSAWAFRCGEPKSGFNAGAVYPRPATLTDHGGNGRSVSTEAAAWDGLSEMPATIAPDARTVDPREVARWAWLVNRTMPQALARGATDGDFNGGKVATAAGLAAQVERNTLPATIAPDARTVDPREVARWVVTGQWAYRRGSPESGFAEARTGAGSGEGHGDTAEMLASRWSDPLTLPATIAPDARDVHPSALPPGTIAYMDPPYVGTTGYASDLPRSEVVALARRWHAAGAVVCISEAEPIPELTADGWHAVRIDGERKGQKRTFSKQQAEWLTLSDPPAWRPSVQAGLFA